MESAAPSKKKSVDDIWKELNAGSRAKPVPRSVSTGIPGFGIPGVQTHTRMLPSRNHHQQQQQSAAALPSKQLLGASGDKPSSHQQQTVAAVQYDPAAAGLAQEDVQQYVATLQRTINCLSDPDRTTRRNAAGSLSSKLLRGDATTQKATPAMLQVG